MSTPTASRCPYTYEPPDDVNPDERVEVTRPAHERCPHESIADDSDRCLFHHGYQDYPSERVTEQFTQALADEHRTPTFAGGSLPGLDLAGETLTTVGDEPLDLRGVTIDGDLDLTAATVEVPLLLDGAAITGEFRAENASFHAPVSLVDADISRYVSFEGATITGGLVANGLSASYIDARTVAIDGPLVAEQASFSANLLLAHATIAGDLAMTDTTFDWSFDGTNMTVAGESTFTGASVDSEFTLVAAEVEGDLTLRKLRVGDALDASHTSVGSDLVAPECRFGGDAIFEGITVDGTTMVFDGSQFGGTADFASAALPAARASFADAQFDGEVWFTHALIGGVTDFGSVRFDGMSHLRDATFEENLRLREARSTDQFFLHGSTVKGDCDCVDAQFARFQFSATVDGTSDFSRVQFDEAAIFERSTFGGRTWFDDATFAGNPNFSDTRFTATATFDATEFLVEPTFEGTRFATDVDLSAADFSLATEIDVEARRRQMVLARPESLRNEGMTLSLAAVTNDVTVPADTTHLVEDELAETRRMADALSKTTHSEFRTMFEDPLRTARTAVARLPSETDPVMVFGFTLAGDDHLQTGDEMAGVLLAGVYSRQGDEIVFGHLNPEFIETTYLMPIPATDDAFESGAAVATATELQDSAIRNEMLRAALLGKESEEDAPVHQLLLPLLVGVGTLA